MPDNTFFDASRREFLRDFSLAASLASIASIAPWSKAIASEDFSEIARNGKARLGIIGVGSRGRALLLHLQQVEHATIVAVCDDYPPHYEQAIELTRGTATAFTDYRKMLEMQDLDAVVIATPLDQHAHIAIDAMESGLDVFCEKSMARTLADCRRMVETRQSTGKILQIGHQRLFNPIYLNAIERVRRGEIGKVTQIRAYWHRNNDWRRAVPRDNPELERKINWRMYRESSAGLMTELASHQIQVANWFFDGIPERVMGSGSICFWRDGREVYDQVALIYDYSDGRKLVYDSMINNMHYGLEEQILGHLGTLEMETNRAYWENPAPAPGMKQLVEDIDKGEVRDIPIGGASWIPETAAQQNGTVILEGEYSDTSLQMEAFAAAVLNGSAYPGMLREAYHATVAALLGEQAMDSGQAVAWPRDYIMPNKSESPKI